MRRLSLRPILITLLAGAAGALLQWSASGGFAEITPGRIATLPVAILLGPWYGIAATLLSALPGTLRPLLVVLRLIEALIVGAAARRGHSPLLVGGLNLLALAMILGLAPEWRSGCRARAIRACGGPCSKAIHAFIRPSTTSRSSIGAAWW